MSTEEIEQKKLKTKECGTVDVTCPLYIEWDRLNWGPFQFNHHYDYDYLLVLHFFSFLFLHLLVLHIYIVFYSLTYYLDQKKYSHILY